MIHKNKIGIELTTKHITPVERDAVMRALEAHGVSADHSFKIADTRYSEPGAEVLLRVREITDGENVHYFVSSKKTRLSQGHGVKLHHESSDRADTRGEAESALVLTTKTPALTLEGERLLYRPAHEAFEGVEVSIDTIFKKDGVTLSQPLCRVKFEIPEDHEPSAEEIAAHSARIEAAASAIDLKHLIHADTLN